MFVEFQAARLRKSRGRKRGKSTTDGLLRTEEKQRKSERCSHENGIFTTFHEARWEVSRELPSCHFPRDSLFRPALLDFIHELLYTSLSVDRAFFSALLVTSALMREPGTVNSLTFHPCFAEIAAETPASTQTYFRRLSRRTINRGRVRGSWIVDRRRLCSAECSERVRGRRVRVE